MKTDDGRPKSNRVSNENYVDDINFTMKHTRWLLTCLGIWPYVASKRSSIGGYASRFLLPVPSLMIIILVTPLVSHVILRKITRSQFIMLLGPIVFRLINVIKNLIFVWRRHSLKDCMRHMEDDWSSLETEEDRQIMKRNLRTGHRLALKSMTATYSSGLFYYVMMPLSVGERVNEFNITVRPLIFTGVDIYIDLEAGYNYKMVFCSNCVTAFFLYTSVVAITNVAATLLSHACGQIQIVASRLNDIVGADRLDRDRLLNGRIKFIVRRHIRVLRFASGIDEILREMCFVDIIGSTLIICLAEYYWITEWNNSKKVAIMTYVILLVSLCYNIFVFCHIGELLKEQCQLIGRAAYMTDWYKLPGRAGSALVMIIAMAQYPRKLSAGGMMELSYISFGSIIKTSFAYMRMCRSMTE